MDLKFHLPFIFPVDGRTQNVELHDPEGLQVEAVLAFSASAVLTIVLCSVNCTSWVCLSKLVKCPGIEHCVLPLFGSGKKKKEREKKMFNVTCFK